MGSRRPPLVLLLAANPTTKPLELREEVQAIRQTLAKLDRSHLFQFVVVHATTPDALQEALLQYSPAVVQFSGHGLGHQRKGEATGILFDSDEGDGPRVVSGAVLGQQFLAAGRSVRLVLLNACHSEEQAEGLLEHVDFVIGMNDAIDDYAARAFSKAFYRALAFGRTIHDAFQMAIAAMELDELRLDATLPRLHARAGADASTTTIVAPPEPDDSEWDVYIAYAKPDEAEARRLAAGLDERGLRAYCFEGLLGTAGLIEKQEAIIGSKHGLVVISTASMSDKALQLQYTALLDKAFSLDRLLIPTVVGDGDLKLPPFLALYQSADLRGKTNDERAYILDEIKRSLVHQD